MDQQARDAMTSEARTHIREVREAIENERVSIRTSLKAGSDELKALDVESEETKMIQEALLGHSKNRLEELDKLHPSPYFTRCDLTFSDDGQTRSFYFGKFSFDNENIFSWTAPAASIRFEEPGPVSYVTPEDGRREGVLARRDQYMIVDGKLIFLASEATDYARELVYQEYLSKRGSSFALPEIVAQMEKAQDQVIRAHHKGPFLISGPAGSGKTTLALHRVAYLTQSPDTSRLYPSQRILVFVQDTGTKDYFSHLLPELGIHNVRIATFSEWAFEMLGLTGHTYLTRLGSSEKERDQYEYQKLKALREAGSFQYRKGMTFAYLEKIYKPFLNAEQWQIFQDQKKDGVLDRYDLTILLRSASAAGKGFWYEQVFSVRLKNGTTKRQVKRLPMEYALIVVDEFQNYLPEQLRLFRSQVKAANQSVLYVGDMAQQTQFGTISDWSQIDEKIGGDRAVKLHKVYRNTRNILTYISELGYKVEIPEGIKEGKDVAELQASKQDELAYVRRLVEDTETVSIGVLCKDQEYLAEFKKQFATEKRVHCMGIREAQGVEFEIVCLVGVSKASFAVLPEEGTPAYVEERRRINKDLLYVALTRAISELHVLGADGLKESIESCLAA